MAIITHYPHVPIVTTNVATDAARNDNEHKPVVAPADRVTRPHSERAVDPEKEHDARQRQRRQSRAQPDEDEVSPDEESEKENLKAKEMPAIKNAALSRQDIKVRAAQARPQPSTQDFDTQNNNALTQEGVRQVRKTLDSAYQTQEHKPESKLSEWS